MSGKPRPCKYGFFFTLIFILPFATRCGGEQKDSAALFSEDAVAQGLEFRHFNGMSGRFYIAEIMGAGAALFDYDNDGDLDVYFVQGRLLGDADMSEAVFPVKPETQLRDRLFRNDLSADSGLRFTDVTEAAGIDNTEYGMGVATGDYDNDGFVDLYITNLGPNKLLKNLGDGTFQDVTLPSGTAENRWSVSAAFVDIDNDGWLDLYVGNYLDFDTEKHKPCFKNGPDYCHPLTYAPVDDRLFRNRGDGTFEDISGQAGLSEAYGNGLGVVAVDLDENGLTDLYVANDGQANFLWLNQDGRSFSERALMAGAALNAAGQAEASMGIDAGDFDGDGDADLFMTHLAGETNTIYTNEGNGLFVDRTIQTGLSVFGKPLTGFGTAWFDIDNDGWLDLFVVNGAVTTIPKLREAGDPFPMHQPNLLMRNLGDGRFEDISAQAGEALSHSEVSRGAAFGDINNDGAVDVLVTNNSGLARLLLNQTGARRNWIGIRAYLPALNRDAIGAKVTVSTASGRQLVRWVRTAASYASANDPRLVIGLDNEATPVDVSITWPGGVNQTWQQLAPNQWHQLDAAPN